jgi:autotransporter-associated beta strand protein
VIASGATLDLANVTYSTTEAITNSGTLSTSTGTSSYAGTMTLGADATIDVDGTQLTISTAIGDGSNGYAITKEGTGTLVLSATSTYTGDTTINAGTVKLTGNLNSATDLVIASGATFDLQAALTAATLDLDGTISNTAGTSSLVISGVSSLGGSVTTTSTQTYTGATTLTGHTTLATTNAKVTFSNTINSEGSETNNLTVTASETEFNGIIGGTRSLGGLDINGILDLNAEISAASSVDVSSTSDLGANVTTAGNQSYWGATIISTNISLSGNTLIAFLDSLDSSNTNGTSDERTFTTTLSSGTRETRLVGEVGGNYAFGAMDINGNFSLSADIVDAASLSVSGTSDLGANVTTSGTQTYTGATVLSTDVTLTTTNNNVTFVSTVNRTAINIARDLTIDTNGNIGTVLFGGLVSNNGTLGDIIITGNLDLDAEISYTTSISVSGTSNLGANVTTTGTQTYTGNATINGNRTLTTTNSNVTFSGTTNAASAGDTLTIAAGSGDVTFTGAVGGSTALGNTTITTGALSAANMTVQGTIDVTNTSASSITGVIADGASAAILTKAGSGLLTLSGANTFTGTTTINAGTISIGADNGLGAAPGSVDVDHLTINGGTLNTSATFSLATNRGITIGASHATIDVDAAPHSHTQAISQAQVT